MKRTTKRGRDAGTGQFIPISEARRRPKTTIVQKIKTATKQKKR